MKMRKVILLMSMLTFVIGSAFAQTNYDTISATYTAGDIMTDRDFTSVDSTSDCPGVLNILVPANAIIVGVDVEYSMTTGLGSVMAEQRSEMRCTSPGGTNEGSTNNNSDWNEGTWMYSRTGLSIANGVTSNGFFPIAFELHAGRSQDGAGCSTEFQKVDDGTWTVEVIYMPGGSPNFPSNPMPADLAQLVDVATDLTWDFGADTDTYDLFFGTDTAQVVFDAAAGAGTYDPGTLAYATTYYWYVVGRNALNEVAGPVWSFTTDCEPLTYPHFNNFDSETVGELPPCWLSTTNVSNPDTKVQVAGWYDPHSAPNVIQFNNQAGEIDPQLTLVLPIVGTVSDYMISFYGLNYNHFFQGAYTRNLEIGTMSDPFDASTFTGITSFIPSAFGWTYFEHMFIGYVTTDEYIAIRTDVDNFQWQVFLDDLTLDLIPTCIKPIDVVATEILSDQVTLDWTDLSTPASWNVEYGLAGFVPTGTPTETGLSKPAVITGLTDATDYDFYLQADCGGGDLSAWSQPLSLQTACLPYALPIDEDFGVNPPYPEVPELPVCWTMISETGGQYGGVWVQTSGAVTGLGITMDPFGDATSQLIIATPEIDVPLNTTRVSFWYEGSDFQDSLLILGTMSDPTDYNTFTGYDTIDGATGDYQYFTIYLNNYVGTDTHIAWRHNSEEHTQAQIHWDDVLIEAIPACVEPYNPWVGGETQTTAMLNWIDPVESATDWEIELGAPGFHPDSATAPTNSYTYNDAAGLMQSFEMTGLTAGTVYDAYIRTDCGGGYSVWVGPMTFLTGFNQFGAIPVTEDFESGMGITGNDPANGVNWMINTDLQHGGLNSVHNAYVGENDNVLYMLGTFDFTAKADLMLSFWQIAKTDGRADHCYVEISTDGGMTYDQLPESTYEGAGWYREEDLYTPFDGPCFDEDSYAAWGTGYETPDNSYWRKEYFNLTDYNTYDNVVIRFRLQTNAWTDKAGWWIDDIAVEALGTPTFYADPLSISGTATPMMPTMTDLTLGNSGSLPASYTATVVYDESDLLFEDFNAGIPGGWTIVNNGNNAVTWTDTTDRQGNTMDDTPFAWCDGYQSYGPAGTIMDDELITPVIDASTYVGGGLLLEFDQAFDADYQNVDTASVYVFDGSDWVKIYESGTDDGYISWDYNYVHKVYDISAYANANLQVKFKYTESSLTRRGNYFAIDNFRLRASLSALGWLKINDVEYTDGVSLPDADMLPSTIIVAMNATGIAPGVYAADILVTSTDAGNPSTTIPVTMTVVAGSTVNGAIAYATNDLSFVALPNCSVELRDLSDAVLFSTTTDIDGYFEFTGLFDGDYTVVATSSEPYSYTTDVGDINVLIDHLLIAPLTGIYYLAGDVDGSTIIDVSDANLMIDNILTSPAPGYPAIANWLFEVQNVTVSGGNVDASSNGLQAGDADGSWTPAK